MENYLRLKRLQKEERPEKLMTFQLPRTTFKIITDTLSNKQLTDINNNVNNANIEHSSDTNYNPTIFTISNNTTNRIQYKSKSKDVLHNDIKWMHLVIFLSICLLVTAIIIIIIVMINGEEQEICVTPTCVHAANTTLKYMNSSVNPCNDFYDFACGNYVNNPNIQQQNIFQTVRAEVESQIKGLFEESLTKDKPKCYKLLTNMYHVCMNVTEKLQPSTIKETLRTLGDWPLLEGQDWNETNFNWTHVVYKMRKIGFIHNYFVTLTTQLRYKNDTRHVGLINSMAPTTPKGKDYDSLLRIAVQLGVNTTSTGSDINDVLNFRKNLSAVSCNSSELFNITTITEFQTTNPQMNWLSYLRNIVNIPQFEITENYQIYVPVSTCLYDTLKLLQRTPKRTQANLMFFYSLRSIYDIFSDSKNVFKFMTPTNPINSSSLRSKKCIDDVSRSLGLPLQSLYVKKYFNKDKKLQVENLVEAIRDELYKIIKAADWLDDSTKTNALDKLLSMKKFVAYPDELISEEYIEQYYDKLEINFTNYLTAMMSVHTFNQYRKYSQLIRRESDWVRHCNAITVNAFYYPGENCIEIPAAILHNIVFDENRPSYLNYGMIGSVIGHEITHGFDSTGRQFDKHGNRHDWWSKNTASIFQRKVQCIIDQYQNYKYPELNLNVNGNLTQGENVADNGGIKQAYLAYQNLVKRNGVEKILPKFKYTQNQMFWISAAQFWCSKSVPEIIKHQISTDPHSPNRFRVIGSFSNFKEFSKDFNCPVDSPMNPRKKCKVW